jgi:hypothetical protein
MSKEKIEAFWKDATAEDVARVMRGEKVEARFRDYDDADWTEFDLLGGFATSISYAVSWFDFCGVRWFQCQVYDHPQWWLDKPDPGEGFRLLGKFPDEEPLLGDSVFCTGSKRWVKLDAGFDPGQRPGLWYRRRIEPVEPVKAISMSDFEAICNGELVKGYAYKLPNGQTITITAKGFEVAQ